MHDEARRDAAPVDRAPPAVACLTTGPDPEPGRRVLDAAHDADVHLRLLAGPVAPGGRVVGPDRNPSRPAIAVDRWAAAVVAGTVDLRLGDVGVAPRDACGDPSSPAIGRPTPTAFWLDRPSSVTGHQRPHRS